MKPTVVDTDPIESQEAYDAVVDWLASRPENNAMSQLAARLCARLPQTLTPEREALLDQDVNWLIEHFDGSSMCQVAWRLSQTIRSGMWPLPSASRLRPDDIKWVDLERFMDMTASKIRWKLKEGLLTSEQLRTDYLSWQAS